MMYRDFRYLLPFLLQLLFFSSQIVYTLDIVEKEWIRNLLAINPMNAVIELFRAPLIGLPPDPDILIIGITSGLLITIAGIFYFSKTQSYFADIA